MIKTDLSKQQALDADPNAILQLKVQQIKEFFSVMKKKRKLF